MHLSSRNSHVKIHVFVAFQSKRTALNKRKETCFLKETCDIINKDRSASVFKWTTAKGSGLSCTAVSPISLFYENHASLFAFHNNAILCLRESPPNFPTRRVKRSSVLGRVLKRSLDLRKLPKGLDHNILGRGQWRARVLRSDWLSSPGGAWLRRRRGFACVTQLQQL